ncbi:MAG: HNH endonuclease signature motif containing protein [bacterium]|nr:HNH endonuclease signature motif containing protein [bacterium]
MGCGAKAAWCQAHHIIHWQDGGPTNLDNMTLLCTRCHHKVHNQNWTIHKTPAGKYTLQPPPTQPKRPPRRSNRNRYPRRRKRRHTTQQRK